MAVGECEFINGFRTHSCSPHKYMKRMVVLLRTIFVTAPTVVIAVSVEKNAGSTASSSLLGESSAADRKRNEKEMKDRTTRSVY